MRAKQNYVLAGYKKAGTRLAHRLPGPEYKLCFAYWSSASAIAASVEAADPQSEAVTETLTEVSPEVKVASSVQAGTGVLISIIPAGITSLPAKEKEDTNNIDKAKKVDFMIENFMN